MAVDYHDLTTNRLTGEEQDVPDVFIVDRGGQERYRTIVEPTFGPLEAVTGWCKTIEYCQRKAKEVGGLMVPIVKVDELSPSRKRELRISPYSDRDLRSALQKLIRRSYVQPAVDVAWTLLANGRWWLGMRAPILCVEDVGWPWLARLRKLETDEDALRMVAWMAATPKNQEAGELHAIATHDSDEPGSVVRYAWGLLQQQRNGNMGIVERRLTADAQTPLAQDIVQTAMWRARQWAMDDDQRMLICGAALAVHDQIAQLPDREAGLYAEPSTAHGLPWWCFDTHSSIGGKAARTAADELGVRHRWLGDVWFFVESLHVEPSVETRWHERSRRRFVRDLGFDSDEAMQEWWRRRRRVVEAHVRKQMP